MSTGYLVFGKLILPYDCEYNKKKAKKQILKMLRAYFIWSILYLPLACIIFVTLFIFDVFIDNVFLRLSVCVAFFIFVQNLKVKKVTDAQSHFLRRMSTVVFYAHMIIFFLWGLIDGKEPSYGFTGFIASLVGTVVLAVIISANRIKNSRLVRELFG